MAQSWGRSSGRVCESVVIFSVGVSSVSSDGVDDVCMGLCCRFRCYVDRFQCTF